MRMPPVFWKAKSALRLPPAPERSASASRFASRSSLPPFCSATSVEPITDSRSFTTWSS